MTRQKEKYDKAEKAYQHILYDELSRPLYMDFPKGYGDSITSYRTPTRKFKLPCGDNSSLIVEQYSDREGVLWRVNRNGRERNAHYLYASHALTRFIHEVMNDRLETRGENWYEIDGNSTSEVKAQDKIVVGKYRD